MKGRFRLSHPIIQGWLPKESIPAQVRNGSSHPLTAPGHSSVIFPIFTPHTTDRLCFRVGGQMGVGLPFPFRITRSLVFISSSNIANYLVFSSEINVST